MSLGEIVNPSRFSGVGERLEDCHMSNLVFSSAVSDLGSPVGAGHDLGGVRDHLEGSA